MGLHYDSATMSLDDIVNECEKNKKAIEEAEIGLREQLQQFRLVTVIFTTQPLKCTAEELPDDCLVVAKDNFETYFGRVFASRAVFGMVGDVNLNFTSPARIVNRVEGIGSAIAQAICGKRPYFSADDVIEKNPDHGAVLKRSSRAVRMPLIRSSRTRRQAALIPTTRMKTYIFPLVVFIAKVDWVFFFFILSLTEGSIELLFYNTSSSLGRSNYHFIYFYFTFSLGEIE